MSFSRMSRGKSRSMSGTASSSRLRKRANGGAAPAPRRQRMARGIVPAHLQRALARELEHVPVEEEEAREPELIDQLELLLEPRPRLATKLVLRRIAILECAVADVRKLDDGRFRAVREVGIAVAELLRRIEPKPVGELDGPRDRCAVIREAFDHVGGREQDAFVISTPLGLAAVEGAAVANGDEDVLQRRAAKVMRMHVARGDRRDTE